MVFYLKYRPQKIAELDLVEVRSGLEMVLASGRIPHAFLFAGPRGTGKTSAARIIAKAVNCKRLEARGQRSVFEPCNRCVMCQSITTGTALDLIEVDAASNRGIDDIRYLREKIKLTPVRAKCKVYIIDEVHMLTNEAFNALLKTLEEPPAHAIFILCTTQPEKLPATIISRCTRFNFRKGRPDEMVNCLQKVVRGEKLRIEKEALSEIAKHVDGSFRDAQKILEQLSLSRRKITVEKVREEVGKSREFRPETLLEFLVEKDAQQAIKEINKAMEGGVNLGSYLEDLLLILRDYLLQIVGFSDQDGSLPFNQAQLVRLIELFTRAGKEVKKAIIPQLPVELAIVEWCGMSSESAANSAELSKLNKDA